MLRLLQNIYSLILPLFFFTAAPHRSGEIRDFYLRSVLTWGQLVSLNLPKTKLISLERYVSS